MALAKKCDICGKLFEHYERKNGGINGISFIHNSYIGNQYKTVTAMDACPGCLESIYTHLKKLGYEE